jgi:ribosomal protein S18 acetylase RimI-like enzyme
VVAGSCDAVVRRAAPADVPACAAIVRSLPEYFTPDVPDEVGADMARHACWVTTAGAEVVGFAVVRREGPLATEILWAAVAPERRSRGFGTALIDTVLDELAADGVLLVEAKTLDARAGYAPYEATRAFWAGRGFVQVDCIDPYPGWQGGDPAAIMVAALGPTRV